MLVGRNTGPEHEPVDLPRNQQGRALIGDPRNDVHFLRQQPAWKPELPSVHEGRFTMVDLLRLAGVA